MTPQRFSLPLTLLLAFLVIPSLLYATDVSGPVSGIWTLSGSPYNVVGEIIIPANQSLTIEPGVQVVFQGWYKFIINGNLQAVGTIIDSTAFTAANTSTGWHGLRFYDISTQPDSSRLVYCKISYGKSSSVNSAGDDKNGGAIFCLNSSKVLISHCKIHDCRTGAISGYSGQPGTYMSPMGGSGESVISGSGGAIFGRFSDISVNNSIFMNNHTGDAVGGGGGSGWSPNSPNSYGGNGGLAGNGTGGSGGALCFENSSMILSGNNFINNYTGSGIGGGGGHGGGIQIYAWSPNVWVYGGHGSWGGTGHGGGGGAIYLTDCTVSMSNNLLIGNCTGNGIGGDGGDGGGGDAYPYGYGIGGNGGGGGSGAGGASGTGTIYQGQGSFRNLTISNSYTGTGEGGAGGEHGYGSTQQGSAGPDGSGQAGIGIIYSNSDHVHFANSIFWNNTGQFFNGSPYVTYSCIQGGWPGIGNFEGNPLFIGGFFLSQIASGQSVNSPCVNSGCPDSSMIVGTTRTDFVQDSGIVDMGFHYSFLPTEPALVCSPPDLHFSAALGGLNPGDSYFRIGNMGPGSFSYTISEDIPWLSLSVYSGGPVLYSQTDTIEVTVDITGLAFGHYQEEIIVYAPGATGNPETVSVSLTIGTSRLSVQPDSLSFTVAFGGVAAEPQQFNISNTNFGTLSYSLIENCPWLTVYPGYGGPVPPNSTIIVSIDHSNLQIGQYESQIVVNAPFAQNSPDTVGVFLTVGEGIMVVQPCTLSFSANYLGNDPDDGEFLISNIGLGNFNFNIIDTIPWLSVLPLLPGPVPPTQSEIVDVDISGMMPGTYSGDIVVTAPGIVGSPQFVHITLTLEANIGGDIRGNMVPGLHHVVSSLSLLTGDTLSIEPGASLLFDPNLSFDIYGKLEAIGTETDSIIFTSYDQTDRWGGLRFLNSGADSSVLSYCSISRCNSNGIKIVFCDAYISHSLIMDNNNFAVGGGIYCYESNPILEHCRISYNTTSGFAGNGGGIYLFKSTPIIKDCIVSFNQSLGTGYNRGAGIYAQAGNSLIERCTISNNSLGGPSAAGAGLYCYNDTTRILNCTITDNNTESAFSCDGGGIYFSASNAFVANSIISDNDETGIFFSSGSGSAFVTYCDVSGHQNSNFAGAVPNGLGFPSLVNLNGDSCDAYHNIFLDPQFVDPNSGDYHLTANSPCIDAGDPSCPFDPDSTIADMGAFFFYHEVGVQEKPKVEIPTVFSLLPPYPNPFNPTTTIRFGLPVASRVTLEVFDISGRNVTLSGSGTTPTTGFYPAGYHEIAFDGSKLASGIYIARLTMDGSSGSETTPTTMVQKLVLMK